MFEFDAEESFPKREEKVLWFWEKEGIFERSLEHRRDGPLFSFYDGPPFATGLPHYGHLLAGTIKDVVPRYKTMKGFYVPRRFGWDCHGLPIENEIERAKELSGAASIEAFGIDRFNEECRAIVLRYTSEWKKTVERMGRWVDFTNTYRTMDPSFMESVWWVFSQLYQKGLIYEGFKVMPFSMQLGTPLSNFEANLNYKEVDDPSVVIAFPIEGEEETAFLAWTTTPWTLPSNLALMVGAEIEYVKLRDEKRGKNYILAEKRAPLFFKEGFTVLEKFLGKKLKDVRYLPLFPFFQARKEEGAFRVLLDDAVSLEEGTGIVHSAPAFGEVDFYVCKREGIDPVCPVDHNGRFTEDVMPFAGMLVKDADKPILRALKEAGRLFHQATIRHRYPFCWRSDTPLIYKAVKTWFVAVEKIRDEIIASNQKIHWVPDHIKEGRFGKWLENARDWAISRNRYWGTPIPIWQGENGEILVFGSVQALEEISGQKIQDLHRHHIDQITFKKEGVLYRRIPEVFDCWFESGSMPYAQAHFPFEHKEVFSQGFPADFIAEGLDQTRGWFYTLTVLSTALFQKPAFKNVIVNGIILAEDGNKMSKRLKNYPDPEAIIEKFGADAIRLYMLNSPAVRADDLRFSEKGVEHVLRQALIPLWNSFVFLSTYAKIYNFQPTHLQKPKALIDRWLLSLREKLLIDVERAMESYELGEVMQYLVSFIDQLTNWYIRRSRTRFWADEDTPDRKEAFSTLYTVLKELITITAPFLPFLSEAIYQELRREKEPLSIHLLDYPEQNLALRDEALEKEVEAAQIAVSLGHSLRKEYRLKVRQPLKKAHLISSSPEVLAALQAQEELIKEELNVKEIELHRDESRFVQWFAKPNFPILGKKIGPLMGAAQKAIAAFSKKEIDQLFTKGSFEIELEGKGLTLTKEDVQVERKVLQGLAAGNSGEITVALETELNDALLEEGLAREIVNKINTLRKEMGFAVTDRISVKMETSEKVIASFQKYRDYIAKEVLAIDISFGKYQGADVDLNGEKSSILLEKVKI